MSDPEYEDYGSKFEQYDKIRTTPAWDVIKQEMIETTSGKLGIPVSEFVVLDAGCGTGLYTDKMKDYVKEVIALDQNDGMLKRCHEKFGSCSNVTIMKSSLLEKLPVGDQSVHVLMINQVLHHLETPESMTSLSSTKKLLQEFHRILVPGGLLAINHCSSGQLIYGLWYYGLFPRYAASLQEKYIGLDKLRTILEQCCFENFKTHKITDLSLKDEYVYALGNVLNEEFRNADSFWALIPKDDLEIGIQKWRKMLNSGESAEFVKEMDKLRYEYGHICEIFCYNMIS